MKIATYTLFFIITAFGILLYAAPRFTDNNDRTITDALTGLTWTKCSMTDVNATAPVMDNTTNCSETPGIGNWKDAVSACENLNHAGKTDWRLPSVTELHSLIDTTRNPALLTDTTYFPDIPDPNVLGDTNFPYYWSSTTYIGSQGTAPDCSATKPNCAWYVNFIDGYVEGDKDRSIKTTGNYVRCVSGP